MSTNQLPHIIAASLLPSFPNVAFVPRLNAAHSAMHGFEDVHGHAPTEADVSIIISFIEENPEIHGLPDAGAN